MLYFSIRLTSFGSSNILAGYLEFFWGGLSPCTLEYLVAFSSLYVMEVAAFLLCDPISSTHCKVPTGENNNFPLRITAQGESFFTSDKYPVFQNWVFISWKIRSSNFDVWFSHHPPSYQFFIHKHISIWILSVKGQDRDNQNSTQLLNRDSKS